MATRKASKRGSTRAKPKGAKSTRRARGARSSARPARTKAARAVSRPKSPPARRATSPAPATFPNAIGSTHQHLDFTSHALDEVKRFYTEVLGFRSFTHDPAIPYLMVRTGLTSSLGFMPPVPGPPEHWRPPREPALYLHVRDVDRAYRDLLDLGVVFLQEPTDMPWKHRVAILRDPEGRTIMLAQPLAP